MWIPFVFLIAVARTFKTVVNNSGESRHFCLVSDLRGNTVFTIENIQKFRNLYCCLSAACKGLLLCLTCWRFKSKNLIAIFFNSKHWPCQLCQCSTVALRDDDTYRCPVIHLLLLFSHQVVFDSCNCSLPGPSMGFPGKNSKLEFTHFSADTKGHFSLWTSFWHIF